MRGRWISMATALALFGAGCARDGDPFVPGKYSLSGPVTLRGYYVDPSGAFAGTRIIGDADGVPVDLLFGDAVVASTITADGVYRFTGLRSGGYRVRARVIPGIEWLTEPLVVTNRDVVAEDTLRLA